jgi:hypothetical protein
LTIPVQLTFEGMPNTRWWAFEDSKTNFGDIEPSTTDLAKLLFIEFGLVYANDWFLLPQPLSAGSIACVRGMAITNVFGERTWVEPAGKGPDDDWQQWRMFYVNRKGHATEAADSALLLLPAVAKIQDGQPREEVVLVRDEMANMVWGVETLVPLATGESKPGGEAGRELHNFLERLPRQPLEGEPTTPRAAEFKAPIRYRVMGTVPENWIPFIPVHTANGSREIQLQRAAIPRILSGDPGVPAKVRPRTLLLRTGLDVIPAQRYYVNEEEVPRAGVKLSQGFRRTRWYGGRVVTWLGVKKQTGRGEGSSGLRFDYLVNKP